jgi:alanyl-tRNA synthetase
MHKRFPKEEYQVDFFDEEEFVRKLCPKCHEYFWTLDPDMTTCGEATPQGCALSTFINNPPTKHAYSLEEMRETFLSFFEKRGHKRMNPYPVVARWRDDLYLTSASIVDFQPYVTNGIIPPPANPLVISQPCIRLVDVDNTGPTFGRHLTFFEMGGHHAFNYPDKEVYWKERTVRYHHEFVTEELGIPAEKVVYKEDVWSGGGNAGPDLETIVLGLELATLVFMKFKVVNNELVELPIRTVDTGYGIERYTWMSRGSISGFHAVYGDILDSIVKMAGIESVDEKLLANIAKFSGALSLDQTMSMKNHWNRVAEQVGVDVSEINGIMSPLQSIFAVTDHTKSLAFLLAEGVVPSNSKEGYLTRLLIRRTYRLLKSLKIEDKLDEIIRLQIKRWSSDFPYIQEMSQGISKILSVERLKFEQTLKRGNALVTRIAQDLKTNNKQEIPLETLIELYDSHGLPPEAVQENAAKEKVEVKIPEQFYKIVAERHLQESSTEAAAEDERLAVIADLPETCALYYKDPYQKEFESRILRTMNVNQVVLQQTIFYPEGGGQPSDLGSLEFDGKKVRVKDVQKVGKVIIHLTKDAIPKVSKTVKGKIDWKRRIYHMRAHTATHLIMGAARRVLGNHVWQSGTQKGVKHSRLDISHYQRLTTEEINKIESLANQAVIDNIPVEIELVPRDKAEAKHGFRLYQGGAVPGKEIRVVKVGNWEVEACAGTHVKNTGEVGFIKILHTERVKDGVERIVYATGQYAVKENQRRIELLKKLTEILNAPQDKLLPTAKRLLKEWKETRRENERLQMTLAKGGAKSLQPIKISGLNVLVSKIDWASDEQGLVSTSNEFVKTTSNSIAVVGGVINNKARIVISASPAAVKMGLNAKELASEIGGLLGGGGSGSSDFAQAGGPFKKKLNTALEEANKIIKGKLTKIRNK